ncbi:class I SAM-dependent methyltransferase [uncultured Arcticibacterium sp.]|uniref:class I SAM-dependent methyltransferase n=1 Tax=uncultured Arcticibacterium sp. TaxID=2173042 RepID=UPI0030F6299A
MKIPKFGLILFVFIFSAFSLKAQKRVFDELEYTKNLSEYRANLLLDNAERVDELFAIWRKWELIEPNSDSLRSQFDDLLFRRTYRSRKVEKVAEKWAKNGYTSPWLSAVTDEEFTKFIWFREIRELLLEEVIDPRPPFRLKYIKKLMEELKFYDLHEREEIAELGAGDGMFSLFLGLTGLDLKITVNEIRSYYVTSINRTLSDNQKYISYENYRVVLGEKDDANLPVKLDKVIIRNAFHHFKKREEMLESIKASLKLDGSLFIMEYIDANCSKSIPIGHLEDIISHYGLTLVKEQVTEKSILQEYKFN